MGLSNADCGLQIEKRRQAAALQSALRAQNTSALSVGR
jgi:hypothetical protein